MSWAQGGRSASPRWCSFVDRRWDWTGAVGLKMSPTPQTDPTEGNRSARSEPAVGRIPDQACLSSPVSWPVACLWHGRTHAFIPSVLPPRRRPVAAPTAVASRWLCDPGRLFATPKQEKTWPWLFASESLMCRDESRTPTWSVHCAECSPPAAARPRRVTRRCTSQVVGEIGFS